MTAPTYDIAAALAARDELVELALTDFDAALADVYDAFDISLQHTTAALERQRVVRALVERLIANPGISIFPTPDPVPELAPTVDPGPFHTAGEWCTRLGYEIDWSKTHGWSVGDPAPTDPISETEFRRRLAASTHRTLPTRSGDA